MNTLFALKQLGRFISLTSFLCISSAALAFPDSLTAKKIPHYKFALVLSGGGARGLSQIGVLKALDETHLKPDLIIGTSMGAIVGSLYAAGYSPDSILHIARSVDWEDIFSNSAKRNRLFVSQKSEPINFLIEVRLSDRLEPIPPSSISHGQAFFDLLGPLLAPPQFHAHMCFDSLPVPIRIVTTDLLSGKRVILSSGNLAAAVRASCGVPLAFSPVDDNGMLLMDGGLASNIPVDVARNEGAAVVVSIDVTSPLWDKDDLENPVRLMDQVVAIGVKRQKEAEQRNADLVIIPPLEGLVNTDFRPIDTLVDRGYACMRRNLDTLRTILALHETEKFRSVPLPPVRWVSTAPKLGAVLDSALHAGTPDSGYAGNVTQLLQHTLADCGYSFGTVTIVTHDSDGITAAAGTGTIQGIAISGNGKTSSNLIGTAAGLETGGVLTSSTLRKAIQSLYATNLFNNVNIDMDTARQVRIMVNEKKYWRIRLGLRYDEFHLGEGFIQPAYENLFGRGVCALLHLQYGLRREKYALEFQSNHFLTPNFANSVKLQTYLSTERIFQDTTVITPIDSAVSDTTLWHKEKTLRKSGMLGLIGIQIGRSTMLSSGIHLELYKVQSSATSAFSRVWGLKFLPYALFRLNMDNMDKFPFPTSGMKNFISIGGTSKAIGGKTNFVKFDGSIRRVFTFYKKHTFSPQLRFAWSSSHLPEVEQIYLGGSFPEETRQDMEIYNYVPFLGLFPRALHGDVMGLAHAAYSFALKKNLFCTAGIDWGNVWNRGSISGSKSVEEFVRFAPLGFGIGLAAGTIVGPIRCSYGRLIRDFNQKGIPADNQLYFSIGHDF
jgi:predicted acylesterase/phospholipase RssA